ncbi:hypothetical protein DFA_01590 [Cavenderia fasciculata]|uniref:Spc7 kinetochore protein domain-containing protein n=1 Tax=Cavenderia fasciculata TaxID=261658 RepID=F4PTN4_CACFS|nr:uncharacterized protein DFA_01590 [Cavenderia fasciculata]EGG21704.1 hypothetical protein DFA_01590 [Cavenderia fasciculata]|eukprot:XP_004359554.1 hypothetical protein DFA_01590 [Cavenderia fasciculata]
MSTTTTPIKSSTTPTKSRASSGTPSKGTSKKTPLKTLKSPKSKDTSTTTTTAAFAVPTTTTTKPPVFVNNNSLNTSTSPIGVSTTTTTTTKSTKQPQQQYISENKENKTDNLDYLIKQSKEKDNNNSNDNKKRKNTRVSMGRVSFSNTIAVRYFEKTGPKSGMRKRTSVSGMIAPAANNTTSSTSTTTTTATAPSSSSSVKSKGPFSSSSSKPRNSPFGDEDDSTDSSMTSSSAGDTSQEQPTMDFTGAFGRIFVPFVKDEIQPLKGGSIPNEEYDDDEDNDQQQQQQQPFIYNNGLQDNSSMMDISASSMEVSALTEESEFNTINNTNSPIMTSNGLSNILDDSDYNMDDQQDEEQQEQEPEEEEEEEVDISKFGYSSIIDSPAHKKKKQFLNQSPTTISRNVDVDDVDVDMTPKQPTLLGLLADQEDLNQVFIKPMTPTTLRKSSNLEDDGSNSPIPTLTEMYEDDMTGNFKAIIEKIDNNNNNNNNNQQQQQDDTIQFHLQNGTNGIAGAMKDLLDENTTETFNFIQHQQQQQHSNNVSIQQEEVEEEQEEQDMTITQSLGNIIQLGKQQLQLQESTTTPITLTLVNTLQPTPPTEIVVEESLHLELEKDMTITQSFGKILQMAKRRRSLLLEQPQQPSAPPTPQLAFEVDHNVTNNLKGLLSGHLFDNGDETSNISNICSTTSTSTSTSSSPSSTETISITQSNLLNSFLSASNDQKQHQQQQPSVDQSTTPIVESSVSQEEPSSLALVDENIISDDADMTMTVQEDEEEEQDNQPKQLEEDKSLYQSNLGESMVTRTQTIQVDIPLSKQYACTPSFTAYEGEGENSFVVGKLNFNKSNITTDRRILPTKSQIEREKEEVVPIAKTTTTTSQPSATTVTTTTTAASTTTTTRLMDPILLMENHPPHHHHHQYNQSTLQSGHHHNNHHNSHHHHSLAFDSLSFSRPMMGTMAESTAYGVNKQSMMLEDLLPGRLDYNYSSSIAPSASSVSGGGGFNSPPAIAHTITFNEFLYLANCRFMDDYSTKSKRPSLGGLLSNNNNNNTTVDQSMTETIPATVVDDESTTLKNQLVHAYIYHRMSDVLKAGYEELKKMMAQTNESNREKEEQMNTTNPSIFAIIQRATKDGLLAKQNLLKKIKINSKLNTQLQYIQWRRDLERKIGRELTESRDSLSSDLETLITRAKSFKEVEMSLLSDGHKLKDVERQLEANQTRWSQKLVDKGKDTDHNLVLQLEQRNQYLRLLEGSLANWTIIHISNSVINVQHRDENKYNIVFKLQPKQQHQHQLSIVSCRFVINSQTVSKMEQELVEKLSIEKNVLEPRLKGSLKYIKETLEIVSVSITRIQRLCREIEQLERLYNIKTFNLQQQQPLLHHSNNYSNASGKSNIGLELHLSNMEAMKKIKVRLLVPTTYPTGNIEYSFVSMIGNVDHQQITSTLSNHTTNYVNNNNNNNNNRYQPRNRLTKIVQSLDSILYSS